MTDHIFAYIDPGSGYVLAGFGAWIAAVLLALSGFFILNLKRLFKFMRDHKHPLLAVLLVLTVSAAVILGVNMFKREKNIENKIIILGFDAMDPKIVDAMLNRGELPNFARLRNAGSYSRISTTNPAQSPVAWAGFATGKNPGKHGIYDFIERDPVNYLPRIAISSMKNSKPRKVIKAKSFWEYTSDKRIPAAVLLCPLTWPPDRIHGKMLSGMGVPDVLGTEGTFSFYTTQEQKRERDIGGNVLVVPRSPVIDTHIRGPKRTGLTGKVSSADVPLRIVIPKDPDRVVVELQGQRLDLAKGVWSDWLDVSFRVGPLKKMRGIVRFYLVGKGPELKLYASPVNFDPRRPFFRISHPPGYSAELAGSIGLFRTQGMPFDTWAVNEKRLPMEAFLRQAENVFGTRRSMLELEFSRLDRGLLFCYFESPDIIQHMFWQYYDKDHPLYKEDAPPAYRNMIERWYTRMDSVLGYILDRIEDEDKVIALSDHGFTTFRRSANINTWLRRKGYLALSDQSSDGGGPLFEDVDWYRTQAYSAGFGGIYLNLKGRERKGIVTGGGAGALLSRIRKDLLAWKDPVNGQKVVREVYLKKDIFKGEATGDAPELYIGFNEGYRASWQTALGAVPEKELEDNTRDWSGTHLVDPDLVPGILFTNFRITKKDPSLYDIAPTVLKLCGFTKEEIGSKDMDGTPLI